MIKKTLLIAILLISWLIISPSVNLCNANDRWEYLGNAVQYAPDFMEHKTYIDTETLSYDSTTGIAKFWFKFQEGNHIGLIRWIEYDFQNNKYRILRSKLDDVNTIINNTPSPWHSYVAGHDPEGHEELLLDYICKKYDLPKMHPDKDNR